MQIKQSLLQTQGTANTSCKAFEKGSAEPKDTIQINSGNSPSMSSVTSQEISREFAAQVLMKNKNVESFPLDSLPKLIQKSQTWSSEEVYGTFSTAVVFSPMDKCYYTGMIGDQDVDKEEGKKYLTAFNEDGSVKWKFEKESITANPAIDDKGNVFLRTQNNLIALDKNGKELWTCKASGSCVSETREECHQRWYDGTEYEDHTPQLLPDGTVCVLADGAGGEFAKSGVTAIKDGKVQWQSETFNSGDQGPRLLTKNSNVYVSTIEKIQRKKGFFKKEVVQRDALTCLNQDGSEKFKIYLNDLHYDGLNSPDETKLFNVGDDGSVYVLMEKNRFITISSDGEKLWEYEAKPINPGNNRDEIRMLGVPVQNRNGNMLVTTLQRKSSNKGWKSQVIEMDRNGKEVWKKEFDNRLASDPQIAPDGDIYFRYFENDNKTEGIIHLTQSGHILDKLEIQKGNEDVAAILSFTVTPNNSLAIETMHSESYETWNHKRDIFVISTNNESFSITPQKADPDGKAGIIEKTEDFVVINGVKVPRKRKN